MRRNKRFLILLIVGITGCLLSYKLLTIRRMELVPAGSGLPDRDIIFMVHPRTLGFINLDGTGYITRTLEMSGGLLEDLLYSPSIRPGITWSPDGTFLTGRFSQNHPFEGYPMLITEEGEFIYCWSDEYWGIGRIWALSEFEVVTVEVFTSEKPDQVVILDMKSCREMSILYVAAPRHEAIREAAYSRQGWLAVQRWTDATGEEIVIFDTDRHQVNILTKSYLPTWSKDGQLLAYKVDEDGLYIANKDGTNARKIVDDPNVHSPSWNTDGSWIVYNRYSSGEIKIYKKNIITGEEVELFTEEYDPGWQ